MAEENIEKERLKFKKLQKSFDEKQQQDKEAEADKEAEVAQETENLKKLQIELNETIQEIIFKIKHKKRVSLNLNFSNMWSLSSSSAEDIDNEKDKYIQIHLKEMQEREMRDRKLTKRERQLEVRQFENDLYRPKNFENIRSVKRLCV